MKQRIKNKKDFENMSKEDEQFFLECENFIKVANNLYKNKLCCSGQSDKRIQLKAELLSDLSHKNNFELTISHDTYSPSDTLFSFAFRDIEYFALFNKQEIVKYLPEFVKKEKRTMEICGVKYQKVEE